MAIILDGTTGITAPDITSSAGLDASDINDNAITAAKLHTTAITDKLGYTPLGRNSVVIGDSTDDWHDLESTALGAGDNVIRRRAKHFTSQGTQSIFTTLINYGWAGYFFRVHLFEFGYLGTGYRSATFSQHGTGTNIVSGSYSPYWRYEMNNSPCHSALNFTGSGPTGGGVDVGYYTVNAQVNVATYTSALIVVEFDQGRIVSGSNPPPKHGVYFY